ncbi:MAG: prolipoprotein diacylglyceryl transferase [Anaerolineae bacterium]|nr:prolipoprotein diacylglyceryl transferase [Anaerolineae bacterium]
MSIDSVGIHLGPLHLRFYGLLIMTGVVLAMILTLKRTRIRRLNPYLVWDMVPWLVIAGIIGARLWHIFTPPQSMIEAGITTRFYLTHPLDALAIWNGGLGLPGAVIGGVLALVIFCRRNRQSFWDWADTIAPGIPLAQAVGRWGNFINQELYGKPSSLPWAIQIAPHNRIPGFKDIGTYHPLFLYECLWNLFIAVMLVLLDRYRHTWLRKGDLLLVYLAGYAFGRFWLEFLRLDPSPVAGININQGIMAVTFLAAGLTLGIKHLKPPLAKE